MSTVAPFRSADLESIARVLGDTDSGLTGSEIGRLLQECGVVDVNPTLTKWKRLFNALAMDQNKRQAGNHVVAFIQKAMSPARYSNDQDLFNLRRQQLNQVLAFSGLALGENGRLRYVPKATTVREAQERADRLTSQLRARSVHPDVLEFCTAELLQEDYFHCVLEATKSIAEKIRALSGLTSDGAQLASEAFGIGKSGRPTLAINSLSTESEIGEQRGFANLLVGLFGTFRNPTAHAPRIYWPVNEQDALDVLSLVSLIHRKLDDVRRE